MQPKQWRRQRSHQTFSCYALETTRFLCLRLFPTLSPLFSSHALSCRPRVQAHHLDSQREGGTAQESVGLSDWSSWAVSWVSGDSGGLCEGAAVEGCMGDWESPVRSPVSAGGWEPV
mmetsp:Transcript_38868/g.76412  ORF Transcript_38868/g.76412 Transcript_38868/m.76412 type:complete len:117 (-) Transcript_38868:34-384(-)